jgi:hypothetical protein
VRRLAVVGGGVLALAGCVVGAPAPAPGPGAQLVLDVTNASAQDRSVGYEYEFSNGGGAAETLIEGCHRTAVDVGNPPAEGPVTTSRILLDGEPVSDVVMPPAAFAGAHIVIRIRIGPAGDVDVDPPVVVRDAPNVNVALPGC